MIYRFHDYVLDEDRCELQRAGTPVAIEPQVFRVLVYLVRHRHQVVGKGELLERCWPEAFVTEAALTRCLSRIRGVVQAEEPLIKTVRKHGYRFIAPVTEHAHQDIAPAAELDAPGGAALLLPESLPVPASLPGAAHVQGPPAPLITTAERRQLTIVSCDLVDYTSLSERLEPEDLREVIREYHRMCAEVVNHFDGYLTDYVGRNLLAYFGYPSAHEDAARRAVQSGLRLVVAMHTLNPKIERLYRIRLHLRIGIHTGIVVIGMPGTGSPVDRLAIGSVLNIATLLHEVASPDTVLVSAATYSLVSGYFLCRVLGPQQLREGSQAVPCYRVMRESGAQTRFDVSGIKGLTPLAGRRQEAESLLHLWKHVRGGAGQVAILDGEAGIGKSRLVQWLKDAIAPEPHLLLECRSSLHAPDTVISAILQSFRQTLQWQKEDSPERKFSKLEEAVSHYHLPLEEMVPIFSELLSLPIPPEKYASLLLNPQQKRHKLMEALLSMLLEQTNHHPVLLVIEDVHDLDHGAMEFLTLLINQVPTIPLYVLLTCRPSFPIPWGNRSYLTHVVLNRLTPEDTLQMIGWITGGKRLPAEVVRHLHETTDGVPLFIEEITRAILECGMLKEYPHYYELPSALPSLKIPSTLQDSLMARLDRLETAKAVAQLCAVIGRQFAYEVIQAISPWDEETLRAELDRLINIELLHKRGIGLKASFIFKHALIHEAAYHSLLTTDRQKYHLQIAHTLEQLPASHPNEHITALAYHYIQSKALADMDKLAYYAEMAGNALFALFAWQKAASFYTEALRADNPETRTSQQRAELHYKTGAAHYWDGNMAQCLYHYDQAIDIYRQIDDIQGLATVLMKKTYLTVGGSYGVVADTQPLEDLLERLGHDAPQLSGNIMTTLSDVFWLARYPEKAEAMARDALRIGRDFHDMHLCARASFNIALAQSQTLKVREAVASYDQTRRYARQASNLWLEGWPLQRLPMALFVLGRLDEAEAAAIEAYEFASKTNNWAHYSLALAARACIATARGDVAAAEHFVQETMILVARYRFPFGGALALPTLACASFLQGDWQAAHDTLDRFMQPGEVFEDPAVAFGPIVELYRHLIQVYAGIKQGTTKTIEAYVQHILKNGQLDITAIAPCCALIELGAVENASGMTEYLYRLLKVAMERDVVFSRGWIFLIPRVLGIAATQKQWWEVAEQHFQAGIRIASSTGAYPELGRTFLDYARMLYARREKDDASEAIKLLTRAETLFREYNMMPFMHETQKAMELYVHDTGDDKQASAL